MSAFVSSDFSDRAADGDGCGVDWRRQASLMCLGSAASKVAHRARFIVNFFSWRPSGAMQSLAAGHRRRKSTRAIQRVATSRWDGAVSSTRHGRRAGSPTTAVISGRPACVGDVDVAPFSSTAAPPSFGPRFSPAAASSCRCRRQAALTGPPAPDASATVTASVMQTGRGKHQFTRRRLALPPACPRPNSPHSRRQWSGGSGA